MILITSSNCKGPTLTLQSRRWSLSVSPAAASVPIWMSQEPCSQPGSSAPRGAYGNSIWLLATGCIAGTHHPFSAQDPFAVMTTLIRVVMAHCPPTMMELGLLLTLTPAQTPGQVSCFEDDKGLCPLSPRPGVGTRSDALMDPYEFPKYSRDLMLPPRAPIKRQQVSYWPPDVSLVQIGQALPSSN